MINKDMMPDVYSTNEVKTNKIWIDGKPIYRIVFKTNSWQSSISISSLNIETPIDAYGYVYTNGNQWRHLPFYGSAENNSTIDVKTNELVITSGTGGYCKGPLQIIFEYTKTTD